MKGRTRSAASAAAGMVAAGLLVTGCDRVPDVVPDLGVPGLYRLDVRQGNALNDVALARLEIGMPHGKVLHLLGSPAIDDVFHPNRWDYLYSFAPGGEEGEWQRIVLRFEGDRLARIEGDLPPAGAPSSEPESAKVVTVPPRALEKGFFRRVLRRVKKDG